MGKELNCIKMLVYTQSEATNFVERYFPQNTNKPQIIEFFLFIWDCHNSLQSAKSLTIQKFK